MLSELTPQVLSELTLQVLSELTLQVLSELTPQVLLGAYAIGATRADAVGAPLQSTGSEACKAPAVRLAKHQQ